MRSALMQSQSQGKSQSQGPGWVAGPGGSAVTCEGVTVTIQCSECTRLPKHPIPEECFNGDARTEWNGKYGGLADICARVGHSSMLSTEHGAEPTRAQRTCSGGADTHRPDTPPSRPDGLPRRRYMHTGLPRLCPSRPAMLVDRPVYKHRGRMACPGGGTSGRDACRLESRTRGRTRRVGSSSRMHRLGRLGGLEGAGRRWGPGPRAVDPERARSAHYSDMTAAVHRSVSGPNIGCLTHVRDMLTARLLFLDQSGERGMPFFSASVQTA
jgi:hypothetical protein